MNTCLYIFCTAICLTSIVNAGISNVPPPPEKQEHKSVKPSPIKYNIPSSPPQALPPQPVQVVTPAVNPLLVTATSHKPSPPPSFFGPEPVRNTLVIKKQKPKKHKSTSTKNYGTKRGRPGKDGKKGRRGKKGAKGEPGQNSITGFISAIVTESHAPTAGDTIKAFIVEHNQSMSYNQETGIFTSNAGPGFYEVHYGANWNNKAIVALKVDGNEVHAHFDANTPTTWARESLIIHSNAQNPTFALANAQNSTEALHLTQKGSHTAAYITIKKIN
ncbi:MAG: complement C1q domain-containing protein [Chlamydiales bacterium]|nr:complement C1q domain-containing protein [Chlamydiales bacterium]